MEKDEAMTLVLERAKIEGAAQCDVVYHRSESEDVEVYGAAITKAEASSSAGLGCRLFVEGRPGYAYSKRIHKESIEQMVRDAVDQSRFSSPVEIELPSPPKGKDALDLGAWDESLGGLEMKSMVEASLEMEAFVKSGHVDIESVPHAGVSKGAAWAALRNHQGLAFETCSNFVSAYVSAISHRDGQKKSGGYGNGGRSWSCIDPKAFAEEAVMRSVELLGAKAIPSGSPTVVFSNRVSGSLLSMYLGALSAEQVQKGQSRFAEKLGSPVGSELMHLSCEPHLVGAPGSRWMDSEGVLSKPKVLIDKGHLCTYLYNLESSAKDGVSPTGHGSRGLRGRAGVSFSNLVMALGPHSTSELLSLPKNCLYVTKLEGGAACSSVSGELSIGVQGFWVEQGEIVHPVDAITCNGNFFDLLGGVKAVSKDLSAQFSSVRVPDLLVEGLKVSG
jgi:PmbA protein